VERVAADVEEVVGRADRVEAEDLLPQRRELGLERAGDRDAVGRRERAGGRRRRQRAPIELAVRVQRQR